MRTCMDVYTHAAYIKPQSHTKGRVFSREHCYRVEGGKKSFLLLSQDK